MARQIALLRGINVGGNKKVGMAPLRELVEELGYRDVRTYVQSGNVVFTGPDESPAEVAQRLEERIAATFGFEVSVVVRSRDQLADVVDANPLGEIATVPARYHVVFHVGEVDPGRLADLEPADFAPDVFQIRGRELYLWTPDGLRDSRLAKALLTGKRLGGITTARNWRTVEKLLAIADEGI
jgi:uncharacterized protein (DUF1697 family)